MERTDLLTWFMAHVGHGSVQVGVRDKRTGHVTFRAGGPAKLLSLLELGKIDEAWYCPKCDEYLVHKDEEKQV